MLALACRCIIMCCSAHSHTHAFFLYLLLLFCARAQHRRTHKPQTTPPKISGGARGALAQKTRTRDVVHARARPRPRARARGAATRDSRTAPSLSHRRQRILSPIYNINIYSVNTRAAARARNPERTLHAHAPLRLTHSRHAAALRPRLSPIAGKRSCAGRPFAFFGARAGFPAAAAAAAVGMAPMRAEGSSP